MRLLITTQIVDTEDPMLGFFHSWLLEFSKHYESIEVMCLKEGRHQLPAHVRVHSLGKETGQSRIVYLFRFYRYVWALRSRYDAVFVHMNPEYVVLGGVFWRLWGKRIGLWYTHKAVNLKLRIALALTHIVFTASAESFRISSPKVKVVGHGIDVNLFSQHTHARTDGMRLLTVGRIAPVKRIEEMIRVATLLRSRYLNASLTIVGAPATETDHAYESSLHALVDQTGASGYIFFKGPVAQRNLPEVYSNADVFLNLSDTGSLDKAVLEALLCGVRVVSSNVAFRTMLGSAFVDANNTTESIADVVLKNMDMNVGNIASQVRREHALPGLVERCYHLLAH